MNRFADDGMKMVILTAEESLRSDYFDVAKEKQRLLDSGFNTFDVQDLAAFHAAHPEVELRVAV